jgi:predicted kinase
MLEQRIQVREEAGQDPSDATLQVLNAQRNKAQPLRNDERNVTLTVATAQEDYVQALLRKLTEHQ